MARANLNVSEEISSAFLKAQESSTTRALVVGITGEELILRQIVDKTGDTNEDFNYLKESALEENVASMILFCKDTEDGGAQKKSWFLLCWIPELATVRDKMIYSSSREDLKRHLGVGHFVAGGDYTANVFSDIDYSSYLAYTDKDSRDNTIFKSAQELLVNEERISSIVESSNVKSSAMGVLPFESSDNFPSTLDDFKNGQLKMMELSLEGEKISVTRSEAALNWDNFSTVMTNVPEADARFFLFRISAQVDGSSSTSDGDKAYTFFMFYCPEDCPIRTKMTMSSLKASVISVANKKGIEFTKNIEIRSPADIVDQVKFDVENENGIANPNLSSPNSGAAVLTHSKPMRPGGKSRTAKKKFATTDDDS